MPSPSVSWHLFPSHPSSQPLSCLPPPHPAHPKPRLDTQSCSSGLSSRLPPADPGEKPEGAGPGPWGGAVLAGGVSGSANESAEVAGGGGVSRLAGRGITPGGQVSQGTLSGRGPEPSPGRAGRQKLTPRGLTSPGRCPSLSLGRQVLSSLQHPCQPGAPGTCPSHPLPRSLQVPRTRDGKSGHSPRALLDVTPPPRPRLCILKATLGPNCTAGCSFGKTWWRPSWNRRVWLQQVRGCGEQTGPGYPAWGAWKAELPLQPTPRCSKSPSGLVEELGKLGRLLRSAPWGSGSRALWA